MSEQNSRNVSWDDPLAYLPNELPAEFVRSKPLHDLYEKIKNTRGWLFKYRVDVYKTKTIALRIFGAVPWRKDPVFIGGVTLISGRDGKVCYAINSNRIRTERRAVYSISNNTKLVSVNALPRAVSLLKEVCYPETVEERTQSELERIQEHVNKKYKNITDKINKVSMEATGWDLNKYGYGLGIHDLTRLHKSLVTDIFSEVNLTALRAKYEEAHRKHAEIQELSSRAAHINRMLENTYRVHTEGGLYIVRTMQGSVVGPAVNYKTFEEMPESVRNGVAALRLLGEGFHEDIGVNLDGGNVFWIFGRG